MRLIKARDLGYEPAGTIFSNVSDFSAERVNRLKDKCYDDIEISGFNLMCGGDKRGFFHACIHMPSYVSLDKGVPILLSDKDWLEPCDTSTADYEEKDLVIVWDRDEIQHMIDIFQLALDKLEAQED